MTDVIETVLAALPLPALSIDQNLRVRAANSEARRIFGPTINGRHFQVVMRQPAFRGLVEEALGQGTQKSDTLSLLGADRKSKRYRVNVAPFEDSAVIVSLIDIGETDEANRVKRDFVTDVSHELKTPLTAILGLIETLRGPARNDAEARNGFLDAMDQEAQRMNALVADLLSLSRVESEAFRQPEETVDLAEIAQIGVESAKRLREADGVTITFATSECEVHVPGDAEQVRQVIDNLLRNAVLHSGKCTGISVTLAEMDRDPILRTRAVALVVADDGAGFDPVHIPRLTERFYRIDTHRARDGHRGTGLGLSIVKHIMTRHRGRLKIETKESQGTRVSAIFPA